jgi:type II secretory pathway pseudopilin PulG
MTQRSKSTLFLIEQLIVTAVFAICAAACISILTVSYFYAIDSQSTGNAILKAESAAEIYKATGGNVLLTADLLGGVAETGGPGHFGDYNAAVYYDKSWNISNEPDAAFILRINSTGTSYASHGLILQSGGITVEKNTGEQLVAFTVAARQKTEALG